MTDGAVLAPAPKRLPVVPVVLVLAGGAAPGAVLLFAPNPPKENAGLFCWVLAPKPPNVLVDGAVELPNRPPGFGALPNEKPVLGCVALVPVLAPNAVPVVPVPVPVVPALFAPNENPVDGV